MKIKGSLLQILLLAAVCLATPACQKKYTVSYDEMLKRTVDRLTGGDDADLTDSVIIKRIADAERLVERYWPMMNKAADRTYLWNDEGCIDDSLPPYRPMSITGPFERLSRLSMGYAMKGSKYYKNDSLRRDVIEGMEWMYANKWNPEKEFYGNWWDWIIGMPQYVTNMLIPMFDEFTPEQVEKYVATMDHFAPGVTYEGASTGANKVWQCNSMILRGIMVKDPDKIKMGVDGLDTEFKYVDSGDGFYKDGSYVQHEWHPYVGGYGYGFIRDLAILVNLLDGSKWDISKSHKDMLYDWLLNSYLPFVYKGAMMDMIRGREITRAFWDDRQVGHVVLMSAYQISRVLEPKKAAVLQGIIKHNIEHEQARDFIFYGRAQTDQIDEIRAMLNNPAIKPIALEPFHKQFPMMDRVVHARDNFALGLAMSSNRIEGYEAIDGENMKGWHNGDGATYLYDGDQMQHLDSYWSTIDPYRIPGTTVDADSKHEPSIMPFGKDMLYADGYKSPHSWIGGSSLENGYGIAGMWFKDGSSSLDVKKSWFMVGDEVMALGAGINSSDNHTIETIVENRKLRSTPLTLTVDDKAVLETPGQLSENGVISVFFDNGLPNTSVGYYFPEPADVKLLRESRTGAYRDVTTYGSFDKDTRNYFTLWFDHGRNPHDATYAYVLLPGISADGLTAYAENPNLVILANNPQVQAIKAVREGVTGLNFWGVPAEPVAGVNVSAPASVLIRETDGELLIGVSDPTQQLGSELVIELDRHVVSVSTENPKIEVLSLSPLKLQVDVKGGMGQTFAVSFKIP